MKSSAVDRFHDDSDDGSPDAIISDVEWSKLKSSHLKEGFRDGYSAGQEAALQEAFNEGFSHQVKLDAQDAMYKGFLTALKTYFEREKHSHRPGLNIEQIEDIGSRTNSLLVQLDTVAPKTSADQRIPDEAKVTNEQSKSGVKGDESVDFRDNFRDNISGNVPHDGPNTTPCCGDSNPSGCQRLQHAPEGVSSHGKTNNSSVACDRTKSDCSGVGCCKSTHPQENVCMSGVPEGEHASEGTACGKGNNQDSDFTEPNPSEGHSKSSESESGVENVGIELNQEALMVDISRKCKHLLTELNVEQLLDDLKLN
ncbi:uncharacterized protein LOC117299999 [Asterias rubens]|uniref:uncharacterized protein LOC117299999 n=1 Tax=Asterias rubens TaxID=7604 RepID=UPI0014552BE7|nr:uncharacterized protein LOC117299999 [Asterias rubens]